MKLEKMKAAVAGHYIPTKRAAEIYGEVIEADMPQDFIDGVLFTLAFLSCPPEKDVYGFSVTKVLDNYQKNKAARDVPPEGLSAAQKVIELLKADGFEIVEAKIKRRGDL